VGDRLRCRHSVASGKVAIYPVKRVECEKRKGSEKTNCEQQVLLIRSHKCSKARPKYFSCKRPEVRLLGSRRARVRSIQINPNPKSLIGSSINTPPSREPLTRGLASESSGPDLTKNLGIRNKVWSKHKCSHVQPGFENFNRPRD